MNKLCIVFLIFLTKVALSATFDWEFVSMGTVWKVSAQTSKKLDYNKTERELSQILFSYDMTFSDWNKESELRKLESLGLTSWKTPSPLFLKGLRYSQKIFKQTAGTFDITVGCKVWKVCDKAVGLDQLHMDGKKFQFKKDPKRLTFGGNIKGMAVGALAWYLYSHKIKSFYINAGGGNLAVRGHEWQKQVPYLKRVTKQTLFISHSYPLQKNQRHIFDPKKESSSKKQVSLSCRVEPEKEENFLWQGATSDAWSTALSLNSKLNLPENCRHILP